MIGDEYEDRTVWGVRWGEAGFPVRCRQYNDEKEARDMQTWLTQRYREMGRTDQPELIQAQIVWHVIDPTSGARKL